MNRKTIYIFLDESGAIHCNNKCNFFAIGGYMIESEDKDKVKHLYKRYNYKLKKRKNLPLTFEIKSFDMTEYEKIDIFNLIQDIPTFIGISKIFDKKAMYKNMNNENIFFNYACKILIKDCVIPSLDLNLFYDIKICCDNRNIRVEKLRNLQDYLTTEFCLYDFKFDVRYFDSKSNFEIQLADLIVNTFYNKYKNIKIVEKVLPYLLPKNFKSSLFPKNKKRP
jgi:hypothetical protein